MNKPQMNMINADGSDRSLELHLKTKQEEFGARILEEAVWLRIASVDSMKKASRKLDIRAEYDFKSMKGGVRGKYVTRYRAGSRVAPKRQKTSRG